MRAPCFCLREKLFIVELWGLAALSFSCCWAALTSWTLSSWNLPTFLSEQPEGWISCVCTAFSLLCICGHSVDKQSLLFHQAFSSPRHSNAAAQHHLFTQLMASRGGSVFVLAFTFYVNVIIWEISFCQHPVSEHLHSFLRAAQCITGAHAFVLGESVSFMSHFFAFCLADEFLIIFPEVTAPWCMMNLCPWEDNVRFLLCVIMILHNGARIYA